MGVSEMLKDFKATYHESQVGNKILSPRKSELMRVSKRIDREWRDENAGLELRRSWLSPGLRGKELKSWRSRSRACVEDGYHPVESG